MHLRVSNAFELLIDLMSFNTISIRDIYVNPDLHSIICCSIHQLNVLHTFLIYFEIKKYTKQIGQAFYNIRTIGTLCKWLYAWSEQDRKERRSTVTA